MNDAERQRRWHGEGQNGCLFARLVARREGWTQAEANPAGPFPIPADSELHSLLFPPVTTADELAKLVATLSRTPPFFLEHSEERDGRVALAIRAEVAPGVLAWVMGFGPFSFLPKTRQAPCTEIVIRPKSKPDWLYEHHSHDRSAAHVADFPLEPEVWPSLWPATHQHTRAVLGAPPDLFSAARTTFTLPRDLWLSALSSAEFRAQKGGVRPPGPAP